jgi:hypothetical protein
MKKTAYHITRALLSLFFLSAFAPVHALEKKGLVDVWPPGEKMQYLFYCKDTRIGEGWAEIREIPKARNRYELYHTVDVDGVAIGCPIRVKGHFLAELDARGRPVEVSEEMNYVGAQRTIHVIFNFPHAEMHIETPKVNKDDMAFYNEESVLLEFMFLGTYDLAFRLEPVNPSRGKLMRNFFVPAMRVNVLTDLFIQYEETLTMDDGTQVPTVRVNIPAVLTDLWVAPGGRVMKAWVESEQLEIRAGQRIPAGSPQKP